MTTWTCALDPGYSSSGATGVAVFADDVLRDAGALRGFTGGSACERATRSGLWAASWFRARVVPSTAAETTLLVEWPQIYAASRSPGDPNDLLGLAAVCGAVAAVMNWSNLRAIAPREWKGTAPKDVANQRTLARLSDEEKLRLPPNAGAALHNAIDAVGLGLWHLGRAERRRLIFR
jgi:hypothetical protein